MGNSRANGTVRQKNGQDLSVKLVMRIGQNGAFLGALPTVATSNLQAVGLQGRPPGGSDAATYNSTDGRACSVPDVLRSIQRGPRVVVPRPDRLG